MKGRDASLGAGLVALAWLCTSSFASAQDEPTTRAITRLGRQIAAAHVLDLATVKPSPTVATTAVAGIAAANDPAELAFLGSDSYQLDSLPRWSIGRTLPSPWGLSQRQMGSMPQIRDMQWKLSQQRMDSVSRMQDLQRKLSQQQMDSMWRMRDLQWNLSRRSQHSQLGSVHQFNISVTPDLDMQWRLTHDRWRQMESIREMQWRNQQMRMEIGVRQRSGFRPSSLPGISMSPRLTQAAMEQFKDIYPWLESRFDVTRRVTGYAASAWKLYNYEMEYASYAVRMMPPYRITTVRDYRLAAPPAPPGRF